MTYEVRLTHEAEQDLRAIYEYIAFEIEEPGAAARLLQRIREAVDSLATFPNRHHQVGFEPWASRNTRCMTVGRYLVFYIVNERESVVDIIRVMYGGRDIEAQLARVK